MIKISDHFSYSKLILFSLPSILSMIFTSLYTIIDGIFVSNFAGSLPFAALNLIWPPLGIIQALGFMVATGGSALVSKLLGEHETIRAQKVFSMLLVFTVLLALIFNGFFFIFCREFALLLGSDQSLMADCMAYGRTIAVFMGFCMISSCFNAFLITISKARTALIINLCCGGLNIILDFVFVGYMGLGVFGAALATGLNWILAAILPVGFFISNGTLRYRRFSWKIHPLMEACFNGASEMITNVSISLVAALYNHALLDLIGSDGVISYGIIQYISFVFAAIFIGYGSALIPVIGYHFGAGDYRELMGLLKKSLILVALCSIVITVLSQVSAPFLALIFVHSDEALATFTTNAIRIYSLSFLLLGFNSFASSFFTGLNNGLISGIISFCRTFVFQVAAIMILPYFFGVNGIWNAMNVSEVLSFILSACFLTGFIRQSRRLVLSK